MSKKKVLVLGSGGREHALCWHLKRFGYETFCAPGNDAIADIVPVFSFSTFEDLESLIKRHAIDEVIVGPEKYLAEGVANFLKNRSISVFGPTKEAAQLETDKAWAKSFCLRHEIPTAKSLTVIAGENLRAALQTFKAPYVVKASGLAQGKGVWIGSNLDQATEFGLSALKDHRSVVIEEFIDGEEISYFVLVENGRYLSLGGAQDHKRLLENDEGPNTGGMGAYSPLPLLTPALDERILSEVVKPTVQGLVSDGLHYRGILFFGLMIREERMALLEFNCRLGDPETQALMLRLESPLPELIDSLSTEPMAPRLSSQVALNIVLAAKGYPENVKHGFALEGLEKAPADLMVFHSGTRREGAHYCAHGGRLVSVAALADSLFEAQQKLYPWIETLPFLNDITYRRDIGVRAYRHLVKEPHA